MMNFRRNRQSVHIADEVEFDFIAKIWTCSTHVEFDFDADVDEPLAEFTSQ